MSLRLKHLGHRIFLVHSDTQYPVSSAFFRLQEYYESPYKGIKGRFFTHEKLMDKMAYKDENYEFDYFSTYTGFNVPDHAVKKFFKEFRGDFWRKEIELFTLLKRIDFRFPFYVIGAYDELTLKHEIAHALYYLDEGYRKTMNRLLGKFRYRTKFGNVLKKKGYCKAVIPDEMQAYLTEEKSQIIEYMGFKRKWRQPKSFRTTLDHYIEKYSISTRIPHDV